MRGGRLFGWLGLSLGVLACADDVEPGDGRPATVGDADDDGFTVDDGDCDDADPTINPRAIEIAYDGVDSDCDGGSDFDRDGDGYDSAEHGGDDCDDFDPAFAPGAPELCDHDDNDCDDLVDEDAVATLTSEDEPPEAFPSIEGAVAAAVSGDTVWVCEGDWTVPPLDISDVTLRGIGHADEVVLRAAHPGDTVVTATTGASALIEVTVTGATAGTAVRLGGGTMSMSSVILEGNRTGLEVVGAAGTKLQGNIVTIRDNTKEDGSGAGIFASGPVEVELSSTDVVGNTALDGGGAAFEDGATLLEGFSGDVYFGGNTALRDGGGLHMRDAVSAETVILRENTAGRDGGGAWLGQTSADGFSVYDNVAQGNGGGLALVDSEVGELWGCTGNEAAGDGGGAHVDGGSTLTLRPMWSVTENVAGLGGGAVRVVGGGMLTSEGSMFESNTPDDVLTDVGAWSGAELGEGAFTCTGEGGCAW